MPKRLPSPVHAIAKPARLVGLALLVAVLGTYLSLGDRGALALRDGWWDALQRMLPRDRGAPEDAPAVVVAIDEDSMSATQRWPWPRDLVAELIAALAGHGAAVIASDIFFDDVDPQSPTAQAGYHAMRGRDAAAAALAALEDSDRVLAETINRAAEESGVPVILPVPGVPHFAGMDAAAECRFLQIARPIVNLDPPELARALGPGMPGADTPLPLYLEAGAHLAAIGFDAGTDFVVRRVHALQPICGAPFVLLGPEALRLQRQGFYTVARRTWSGMEIWLDDPSVPGAMRFPAERDGSFWLHFGPLGVTSPDGTRRLARYISAAEVLAADFDPGRIAGKIVLVGVIDLGRIDERRSPLGAVIYGVEAHMQMIEQIVAQDFLRRPHFMVWAEAAFLALAGLLVIWFVPIVPGLRAVASCTLGAGAVMAGSILAFRSGLLIDAASIASGFGVVATGVIAVTMIERDRQRRRAQLALAFAQGELDAAARIQTALLPADRFVRPGTVDLACHIRPARTVGGDFYDHALIDGRHLFLLVADVSGKGADASQFMLLSKTLWKSVALRGTAGLERIQAEANAEITRENAATMFVTGLSAILDLETRRLSYSSAGHEMPFLFGDGLPPHQLPAASGPPAGLLSGADFPVQEIALRPGDRLCLFTDGVTDAMDPKGQMFGRARLQATLAATPPGLDSAGVMAHVTADLQAFIATAEPSDDVTLMILTIPPARA